MTIFHVVLLSDQVTLSWFTEKNWPEMTIFHVVLLSEMTFGWCLVSGVLLCNCTVACS